jgi:hypothetical protein
MNPPYQRRGGIWSAQDKAFLIDSILNEYDIPKVYLADFSFGDTKLNKSKLQYAVIDGKQRFETIYEFFEDKVLLEEDFVYRDDPSMTLGGLSYTDLKRNFPEVADRFANFNLTVMSVITDEDGQINELFVRLNRSRSLTGAEIRNAMTGKVPELVRRLAEHRFFTSRVKFKKRRGEDLNVAAKLLLIEFRGGFVDVKRTNLDKLVREGLHADANVAAFESAADRVDANLTDMVNVFVERDPLLSSQGPVPVYYWLLRSLPQDRHRTVREFLVAFERERKQNRQLAKKGDDKHVDTELVRYDNFNRSTNDEGSLAGRYHILSTRFADFAMVRRV